MFLLLSMLCLMVTVAINTATVFFNRYRQRWGILSATAAIFSFLFGNLYLFQNGVTVLSGISVSVLLYLAIFWIVRWLFVRTHPLDHYRLRFGFLVKLHIVLCCVCFMALSAVYFVQSELVYRTNVYLMPVSYVGMGLFAAVFTGMMTSEARSQRLPASSILVPLGFAFASHGHVVEAIIAGILGLMGWLVYVVKPPSSFKK